MLSSGFETINIKKNNVEVNAKLKFGDLIEVDDSVFLIEPAPFSVARLRNVGKINELTQTISTDWDSYSVDAPESMTVKDIEYFILKNYANNRLREYDVIYMTGNLYLHIIDMLPNNFMTRHETGCISFNCLPSKYFNLSIKAIS